MINKYVPTVWEPGKTVGTADVMNNIENGIVSAYNEINDINLQIKNLVEGVIFISDFDKPSDGDYTSILQTAIDKAVDEKKKIVFGKGVFKITGTISCPDNCTIEIEGYSDAFANSLQRYSKDFNGVNLWYENINNETVFTKYPSSTKLSTISLCEPIYTKVSLSFI